MTDYSDKELNQMIKVLKDDYNIKKGMRIAVELFDARIFSLSDHHRAMILYLQENASDFEEHSSALAGLLIYETLNSLKEKEKIFHLFCPSVDTKMKMIDFYLKKEDVEAYWCIFSEIGFSESEVHTIVSELIMMRNIARHPNEISDVISQLDIFDITPEQRRTFIFENVVWLFDDYSRHINELCCDLVEQYGKQGAFHILSEKPYLLREYGTKPFST